MEDLGPNIFGYDDDEGYYDYDNNWTTNAVDGAFCPEALDSY
jgi:hypothetical protein